jgi:hypothetical protein
MAVLVESYALSAAFSIAYTISAAQNLSSVDVLDAVINQVDVYYQLLSRECRAD